MSALSTTKFCVSASRLHNHKAMLSRLLSSIAWAIIFYALPTLTLASTTETADDADILVEGSAGWYLGCSVHVANVAGSPKPELLCFTRGAAANIVIVDGEALASTKAINAFDGTHKLVYPGNGDDPFAAAFANGDFDNDGFQDIVYALPYTASPSAKGRVYVIYGRPALPDSIDLDFDFGISQFDGPFVFALLGTDVAVGDINGDRVDDLVISAPFGSYSEVFVLYGGIRWPSSVSFEDNAPPVSVSRLIDSVPNRELGQAMACADFDNDGHCDIVLGAPAGFSPGQVIIVSGASVEGDTVVVGPMTPGIRVISGEPFPDGRLGLSMAVGDFLGDGILDIVLGAPYADFPGCRECGRVYVVDDVAGLPDSSCVADVATTVFSGSNPGEAYGVRLTALDFLGSAGDDIAIVSHNTGSGLSRVVVVSGGATLPDSFSLPDTSLYMIVESNPDDWFGIGTAVGDINLDGREDLVIGAHRTDTNGTNSGSAYVFFSDSVTLNGPSSYITALNQNYPNPFNPGTTISFTMPTVDNATIDVFDVAGRKIDTLFDGRVGPGPVSIRWDGRNELGHPVASGVYFYRLTTPSFTQSKKMVVVR